MLPSNTRLSRSEVTNLLSTAGVKVVFNRLGTLKYVKSIENKGFSVVTGSKAQKLAVRRNKIRRQLYTLFGQNKPEIQGILYVSKQAYEMSFDQLVFNFNELSKKAA
jgi:ribonuclease P protein component